MMDANTSIRSAGPADVDALADIASSVDDAAILLGPRFAKSERPSPAEVNRHYFAVQFRSPLGPLGYRRASVAEIDGRIAGFVICTPLSLLKDDIVGDLLPARIANVRYGEKLSSVLNLYLIAVNKNFRGHQIPLQLTSWCLSNATTDGYDYVMTQMWHRNQPSYRGAMFCGFKVFYESMHKYSECVTDRYIFADYGLKQSNGARP